MQLTKFLHSFSDYLTVNRHLHRVTNNSIIVGIVTLNQDPLTGIIELSCKAAPHFKKTIEVTKASTLLDVISTYAREAIIVSNGITLGKSL